MHINFDKTRDLVKINFSDLPVTEFKRLHQAIDVELLLGEGNKLVALCVYSYSGTKASFESLLKEDGFSKKLPDGAIVF